MQTQRSVRAWAGAGLAWFRVWHELPNDPKWRTIARASGQPIALVIALYIHLLTNASMSPERGVVHNFSSEDVATALDVTASDVEAVMAAMQGRVLDGPTLTGWKRRQPEREDGSAERGRAFRARKRAEANAPERMRTQSNGGERKRTLDEEEKRGDEEKRRLIPRGKREADPRHKTFREILAQYWTSNNVTDMPWDASDAKQLSSFLSANRSINSNAFRDLIANRQRSHVNHAERIRAWIARVTDYTAGPLNSYKQPLELTHDRRNGKSDSTLIALRRSLEHEGHQISSCSDGNSPWSADRGSGICRVLEGPRSLPDRGHSEGL